MFGKIVYFDKKTIEDYKALIKGKRQYEISEYEVYDDKGAGIDLKAVTADAKASKKYKARVVDSPLYDCNEFEKMLKGRDDYFDFTESSAYDLTTIPRGSIIKVDALIEIPEGFDYMHLLDMFKPFLIESINNDDMEESGKETIKYVFKGAKATRIPMICDVDDYLLCTKLTKDNLILEYEELEEVDESITILARISTGEVNSEKPFYDPLKDFITLNRTLRRSLKDSRGEELAAISVENNYRMIDVLAIYK